MCHKVLRPLTALIAFTVGVACVLAAAAYPLIEDKFTDAVANVWDVRLFERGAIGCGVNSVDSEYYTLWGQRLQVASTNYLSRPKAEQAFGEALGGATRVVARKNLPTNDGDQMVSERATIITPTGAAIITIRGTTVHTIEAPSLWLAAEFEIYEKNNLR